MSLDLTIPGDPHGLTALAEWLDPQMFSPLGEADLDLATAVGDLSYYWTGAAATAFATAAQELRGRGSPAYSFVQDVAAVIRAYANRLVRGQAEFDDYLVQAKSAGLRVTGKVVSAPTTSLQYCPADNSSGPEKTEYARYLAAQKTYRQLQTFYGTWCGELEKWLAENMAPLTVRIQELQPIKSMLSKLSTDDMIKDSIENYADDSIEVKLKGLRKEAGALQATATMARDGLRSGNPALRQAAEDVNPKELRAGLAALDEAIETTDRVSKLIPIVGVAMTVVGAGVELANGGSASSIGVGIIGSAAGGAVAGAVAATWIVPPAGLVVTAAVGVAVGVAVVAAAAGTAATWVWEAEVPLDVRESIDATIWDPTPPRLVGAAPILGGSVRVGFR